MTKKGRADVARVLSLSECAEVLPGFSVRGRMEHQSDGTHQLLLTRHLTDGVPYAYEPAHEMRITPHTRTDSYQVRRGDVVFMSRGDRNRAWVIAHVSEPTIAPVSFYILRSRAGLDGGYLAWYLNQKPAQAAIDKMRTGAGTPLVQRRAFETLLVPLPGETVQREVAQISGLMARERLLRGRLNEALDRLQAIQSAQIIEGLRDGARRRAR